MQPIPVNEQMNGGNVWHITFAGRYHLIIDISLDQLFLNGQRLKTTHKEHDYSEKHLKLKNLDKQKTRVKTLFAGRRVLAIDLGWDGRIFFKIWFDESNYDKYRRAPDWVASYWNDRKNKQKKIYVQNLSQPKEVIYYAP